MSFSDSNIDLPASPYTIVGIGAGDGIVHTFQGPMSIDEAAQLLVEKVRAFDWSRFDSSRFDSEGQPSGDYELLLDVASLVAEINLYQARALWCLHVPPNIGMPRMLASADEAQEQRYLENLRAQRGLNEDALASHILEQGAFMSHWAEARRQLAGLN